MKRNNSNSKAEKIRLIKNMVTGVLKSELLRLPEVLLFYPSQVPETFVLSLDEKEYTRQQMDELRKAGKKIFITRDKEQATELNKL